MGCFYVPETITVTKTTDVPITVPQSYVQGVVSGSQFEVTYDSITGFKRRWHLALWDSKRSS